MKDGFYVTLGFAIAVIVGLLLAGVVYLIRHKKGAAEMYDERQVLARNQAFQIGFFTMVICMAVFACLDLYGLKLWESALTYIATILIGTTAFATVAIRKDAYFALNQTKRQQYIIYLALSVMWITNTITNYDKLLMDGKLSIFCVYPLCTVMFIYVMILTAVHDAKTKREEKED